MRRSSALVFSALVSILVSGVARAEWKATGAMAEARYQHTATALADGRVLLAAGQGNTSNLSSTELFDPVAGAFSAGPSLSVPRSGHSATLLADGRVLVVGGRMADDGLSFLSTAEVFDPKAGAWATTGPMSVRRHDHAAVRLPSGKVLVLGGDNGVSGFESSAELFDPATGLFTAAGTMGVDRVAHTATLVGSTVIVVGGNNGDPISAVDFFDTATLKWTAGPATPTPHGDHIAVALDATRILVSGGMKDATTMGTATEVFDLTRREWITSSAAPHARALGRALRLDNGTIFVVCGRNVGGPIAATESFDPRTMSWSSGGNLVIQRERCGAAPLPGGRVLVTGGVSGVGYESTAEIFTPSALRAPCASGAACASGACADGVCCDRPCTGVCERCDDGAKTGTCTAVAGPKNHCPAAGQVCVDGACRAGSGTRCTDDGLAFEDGAGKRTSCNAYRCRPADGQCYPSCTDTTQCASGAACDGSRCVLAPPAAADSGCSAGPSSPSTPVLLGLALAGALRFRRRRRA